MSTKALTSQLQEIVGKKHVLTKPRKTAYFRSGFRSGFGAAAAVVFPGTLAELWKTLQACVDAGCAIIAQAAKTGLTEGSCPSGFDYDRDVVVINVMRLKKIILLDGGRQAIVFPGSTLHELTNELQRVNRAPHSVIGSTTIGASVVGGIANNAGGALCKRGSSYTELSLFARVDEQGRLQLVDHLGIKNLGDAPDQIFASLERGAIEPADIADWDRHASDRDYEARIRDLDAEVPNRYNADPKRLFDVSGSAGKVVAFAVRVDTYPLPQKTQVFFIGTDEPQRFTSLRRHVLQNFEHLPEMCEYMNRGIFDTAERYGKDVFLSIKHLGTKRLPKAYALKSSAEYLLNKVPFLPKFLPDLFLYWCSRLFPQHLPKRLLEFRDRFEHYLIFVASDECIDEARKYITNTCQKDQAMEFMECNAEEQQAIMLHRFAAAGAAIRYQNVHQRTTEEVLALDVALLGSDADWLEALPAEVAENVDLALYYGHFMCHVFHCDYIFKKGTDLGAMKKALLERLDAKKAKYPAEHNVGHLYEADTTQRAFYQSLDPTNTFNPGIGKTEKKRTEKSETVT